MEVVPHLRASYYADLSQFFYRRPFRIFGNDTVSVQYVFSNDP